MDRFLVLFRGKTTIIENFIYRFQETVRKCWDQPVRDGLGRSEGTCGELAARIAMLHLVFEEAGLRPGDHIAVHSCGGSNSLETLMGPICGGYVSVLIPDGLTARRASEIAARSGSKILFTSAEAFRSMNPEDMPQVKGIIDSDTLECLGGTERFVRTYRSRTDLYNTAYPLGVKPRNLTYQGMGFGETCAIVYTTDTTGCPRSMTLNVQNFSSLPFSTIFDGTAFFHFQRGNGYI